MRVLVTGANGFVGRTLCRDLLFHGHSVVGAVRRMDQPVPEGVELVVVGELDGATDWSPALAGVDAVVHLAARVHVMVDRATDPLAEFRAVNVASTAGLARNATAAGVRRLVYVSSVKVLGEGRREPYGEHDAPAPEDDYGRSKWEAEQLLADHARATGLEVVTLRPPLVYGPGVRGNFLRILEVVDRGIPLPLGLVDNRRSLIHVGNLADAIEASLWHAAAPGRTYLVSDGEDVATPDLVRMLSAELGRASRLLPVPVGWMRLAGRLLGKQRQLERLLGSLAVDSSAIRRELGWTPARSLRQGIAETVAWYRARR